MHSTEYTRCSVKKHLIFDYNSRISWSIFTARSSYASEVCLVCLFVRLSVIRVLCNEIIEYTADILIPHERVIILVF